MLQLIDPEEQIDEAPLAQTGQGAIPCIVNKKPGRVQRYLDQDPELAATFRKFSTHVTPILSSNYDISRECNLRCEGCLFFEGTDYKTHTDDKTLDDYEAFFRKEVERGVNFAYLAGAEPALKKERLQLASQYFKRGTFATNGTIRIDPDINFSIHVSLWGDENATKQFRGGSVFRKSLDNFAGDKRVTFIYTVNHKNLHQLPRVVCAMRDHGVKLSFNYYSTTEQYNHKLDNSAANDREFFRFSTSNDNLRLTRDDLLQAKELLSALAEEYPDTVIYSRHYSDWISQPGGLYNIDPDSGLAIDCPSQLSSFHRHYHVDLCESDGKCCTPNIDCRDCRAYAMSYSTFRHRIRDFLKSSEDFAKWMEVMDTWCRLYILGWDDSKL